jgi:hypothetical protein
MENFFSVETAFYVAAGVTFATRTELTSYATKAAR